MYRDIENFPVLAKAGAIIPMSKNDTINDCSNPDALEILVYRGNNTFTLYEDDGDTLSYRDGAYLKTPFTVSEDGSKLAFAFGKGEGDPSVVPEKREFAIMFKDVAKADISVKINGKSGKFTESSKGGTITVTVVAKPTDYVEINLDGCSYRANKDKKQELTETIAKYQLGNDYKGMIFTEFLKNEKPLPPLADTFAGPIKEIMKLYRG